MASSGSRLSRNGAEQGDLPPSQSTPSSAPYNTLPRSPARLRSPVPDQTTTFSNAMAEADNVDFSQDIPLGIGLAGQLPRRNHTISSATAGQKTRRLAQHFEQPLPPSTPQTSTSSPKAQRGTTDSIEADAFHSPTVLSPNRNSLKEIAGAENEHDEWERAILDERKSAADDLGALPSASAINSTAAVRRHQSLNHHLGRSVANRMAASQQQQQQRPSQGHSPSTSRQHNTLGAMSPVSISTRLQDALRKGEDPSTLLDFDVLNAGRSSPQTSLKSFSAASPWSNERLSPAALGLNNSAAASSSPSKHLRGLGDRRTPSPLANGQEYRGPDLMDICASLQTMHLGNGTAPAEHVKGQVPFRIDTGSASNASTRRESESDPSSSSSAHSRQKLPNLITNPDALARAASHSRQSSDYDVSVGFKNENDAMQLPTQNRAHYPGGHSRIQSTDGIPSMGGGRYPVPPHRRNGPSGPPPVTRNDISAPYTAAPVSNWADKDRIAGSRALGHLSPESTGGLGQPFDESSLQYGPDSNAYSSAFNQRFASGNSAQSPNQRGAIPSQWGLGLSPAVERGNQDQITYALSLALAEQQQKTAMLEAALRASSAMSSPPPPQQQQHLYGNNGGPDQGQFYGNHHQRNLSQNGMPPPMPFGPSPYQQQLQALQPLNQQQQFQMNSPYMPAARPANSQPPNPSMGPPPAPPSNAVQHAEHSNRGQELALRLQLNPVNYDLNPPPSSRFVVIKSFTEDDVHRSIRHGIWASTDKGNQRLDRIYKDHMKEVNEQKESDSGAGVFLFFSVNGSGHFCGMAQMTSEVDFNTSSDVWAQEGKWKGTFHVKHIFVKDIPNRELRHIPHPNQLEKKSVTQSRDTQELPREIGLEILKIMHAYPARTSILNNMDLDENNAAERGKDSSAAASSAPSGDNSHPPLNPSGTPNFRPGQPDSMPNFPYGGANGLAAAPLHPDQGSFNGGYGGGRNGNDYPIPYQQAVPSVNSAHQQLTRKNVLPQQQQQQQQPTIRFGAGPHGPPSLPH
ncbi:unnamed protein product [Sympodiomycopsis kandeliae]